MYNGLLEEVSIGLVYFIQPVHLYSGDFYQSPLVDSYSCSTVFDDIVIPFTFVHLYLRIVANAIIYFLFHLPVEELLFLYKQCSNECSGSNDSIISGK